MTFWQILVIIAIIVVPLTAAVAVTIWTVPRPGSNRPPRPRRTVSASDDASARDEREDAASSETLPEQP